MEAELRSGLDENGEIQNTENEPDENDTGNLTEIYRKIGHLIKDLCRTPGTSKDFRKFNKRRSKSSVVLNIQIASHRLFYWCFKLIHFKKSQQQSRQEYRKQRKLGDWNVWKGGEN